MKKYWPLACLILIAALAGTAISTLLDTPTSTQWMHLFMGFFLCQFAMLKLFNPSAFADGFQKYDLIGKKSRAFCYLYPLIELGLGLGYLSFLASAWVYWITIVVLGIGAIGVISALQKGLNIRCACMGTVLDVPLSTVTLTEDLAMVAMAVILLLN